MSTRISATNLSQALKELSSDWEYTKSRWNDSQSQDFEEKYLKELPHHVARVATVIEEIDALLSKVKTDCE
jgi:hypothetical protein